MIVLSDFVRTPLSSGVALSCNLKIDNNVRDMVFTVTADEDLAAVIKPNPTAFLMAILIPAMERGEDIHIVGTIDAALLHRLNRYAVSLLSNKYKNCRPIAITCSEVATTSSVKNTPGAATGMSCGVDSLRTHAIYANGGGDIPEEYRLKLLAVFDVGAFFSSEVEYPRILEKARDVGRQSGCRAIGVSANINELYAGHFGESCTLRHTACAYCLTDLIDFYLVSSAYGWNVVGLAENPYVSIEATDPILLPLLSSSRLELIPAVANENRFKKIVNLFEKPSFVSFINTCTRPISKRDVEKNCGTCKKCAEFLLIAQSLGKINLVAPHFDIKAFQERQFRIHQRLFTRDTINRVRCPAHLDVQLLEIVRTNGIPFGSRIVGRLIGGILLLSQALGGSTGRK